MVEEGANVYKLVGPVLVKQELAGMRGSAGLVVWSQRANLYGNLLACASRICLRLHVPLALPPFPYLTDSKQNVDKRIDFITKEMYVA